MKILFCCDGSRKSERAVRFGAQIATASRADSTLLGIAEKAGDEDALVKALRRVQDIFKETDLDAELIVKVGRPVREIIKCTRENHYDLVVIGAMRRNAFRRLFDPSWMSVRVYNIIESIEPPVLVVVGNRQSLRRILLCSGGAEYIDKAIDFAGKIAQDIDAVVDLFHVMPEVPAMYADLVRFEEDTDRVLDSNSELGKTLRHQKGLLEQLGVFGEIRLRQGDVVPELSKELKRNDYDLVVSGSSPAEDKLTKYVMGDVAREIVNRADLPVLVIRTGQRIQIRHLLKGLMARLFRSSRETAEASRSQFTIVHS